MISLYLLNQCTDFGNLRVILGYFFKANPMVRSLYTSADIEKDNSLTSHPVEGFWQFKSLFGLVFQGQSNSEVTVAVMEKDISITSYPMDGFQSVGYYFGVIFQSQTDGEFTLHNSSCHKKIHLHNFWSNVQMSYSPLNWAWKTIPKWLINCPNPSTGSKDTVK